MREILQWECYLFTESKSKATVKNYLSDVQMLLDWIKQQKKVSEVNLEIFKTITLSDLHTFMTYLMNERGNCEATRARRINAIKSLYNYLCDIELLQENQNVARKLKIPKLPQREPVFLTEEECQQLINSIDGCHKVRDTAIIMLFLNTGMRLEELVNIDLSDVKDDSIKVIGKGNKERVIYLNEDTIEAIKDWLEIRPNVDTSALFVSERGNRIGRDSVQWRINETLKQIDREDCSTHTLRHSAASMMLRNGTDVRTVQEVLGHANLNTTARYTHILKQEKKQAAQSINLKRQTI